MYNGAQNGSKKILKEVEIGAEKNRKIWQTTNIYVIYYTNIFVFKFK